MITTRYSFQDLSDLVDYPGLIERIGRFASLAGFVMDGDALRYSSLAHAVIQELEDAVVMTERDLNRWPGTTKLTRSDATRYVFELTPATSEVLMRSAASLFDWHNPRLPEDLHFMRTDRSLVLGTVGHESYAWLELSDDEAERWTAKGEVPIEVELSED